MRRSREALMLAIVAALIATACTGYALTAHAQSSATVAIQGYAFQPGDVAIYKGGTVTWTNQDSIVHDVKFSDSESPNLKKGQSYSKTFDKAGTFDYFCSIHPTMKGRVTVK